MQNKEENIIVTLTFQFAVQIVMYKEQLEQQRKYTIARQLLRSATSIGANVKEAQNAASKKDFLNKMRIAQKEAGETEYWLELCAAVPSYSDSQQHISNLKPILKILNSIISSTYRAINQNVSPATATLANPSIV